MAMNKSDSGIKEVNPASVKVDGEEMEINPGAVQSVTTAATHPADKTSAPVELPTDVNRPPVSTNDPEQPIAHSNISGDMGPTPEPEIHPETHVASNAYVTAADKDNIEKVEDRAEYTPPADSGEKAKK